MGFGIKALAADNAFTVFENLVVNGSLDNAYFGLYLERDLNLTAEAMAKGGVVKGSPGPGPSHFRLEIVNRVF
jgi:shikimate kinase